MKENDKDDEYVFKYTLEDAVNDGMLIDIRPIADDSMVISHITHNLASQGYVKESKLDLPNIKDLIIQCHKIVKEKSNNFKDYDYFFSGIIELPTGQKEKVFIVENELRQFTVMFPEDY